MSNPDVHVFAKQSRADDIQNILKRCQKQHMLRGKQTIVLIKAGKLREPKDVDDNWRMKAELRAEIRAQRELIDREAGKNAIKVEPLGIDAAHKRRYSNYAT